MVLINQTLLVLLILDATVRESRYEVGKNSDEGNVILNMNIKIHYWINRNAKIKNKTSMNFIKKQK